MDTIPHHLLRPSLSGEGRDISVAPHRQQVGLLTAFFGGPLALAVLFGIDARRLGRLGRDAAWIALVAAAYLVALYMAYRTASGQAAVAWLVEEFGRRGPAIAERLIAMLGFALMAMCHRKEQRSAHLFDLPRPNGWVTGVALIVGGNLASWLLDAVLAAGRP